MQNKKIERVIRISAYGDYAAIDYVQDNQIIETPLYLKKDQEQEIKIMWDFEVTNSSGSHKQSEMTKGFIKFDGEKLMCCYAPEEFGSGNGEKFWWEPTEYELKSFAIIHLKRI